MPASRRTAGASLGLTGTGLGLAVAVVVASLLGTVAAVPRVGAAAPAATSTTQSPPLTTRPPAALDAVSCPNTTLCVAVGGAGGVVVSQTGGVTWSSVRVPTTHFLYGVSCATARRCVAVGDAGTAIVTDDGGRTWVRGHTGSSRPLSAVTCPVVERCYAVGDGDTVLDSANVGLSWRPALLGQGVVNGVSCSTTVRCTAVTSISGMNLTTVDGDRWVTTAATLPALEDLESLSGVACAALNCAAVGQNGIVLQSRDGGSSWTATPSPTGATLNAVSCPTWTRCVAVGQSGTVIESDDGGVAWSAVPTSIHQTLLGVSCRSDGSCVAVGSGRTVATSEDGTNWVRRIGAPTPKATITVLVVGDSFARTVAAGLARSAAAYGMTVLDGGLDGCALARGGPILAGGSPDQVTGPCSATGPGWPALYAADVRNDKPNLSLLVLGPWDLATRSVGGRWISPGQPAYDAYFRAQVTAALRTLTEGGGKAAVATVSAVAAPDASACRPAPASTTGCPTEQQRVEALDLAARQAAAAFGSDVRIIDLGHRLTPSDTFAQVVDGVVVRAADGSHVSEPGGEWLTPWLAPRLLAAAS